MNRLTKARTTISEPNDEFKVAEAAAAFLLGPEWDLRNEIDAK